MFLRLRQPRMRRAICLRDGGGPHGARGHRVRPEAPALAKAANSDPEFSARSIYNLAIQGDEDAQRIFRRFGKSWEFCSPDLVNVLNLDMYVIGGGVASAWDAFAPPCSQSCGSVRWSTRRLHPKILWRKTKAHRRRSPLTRGKRRSSRGRCLGSDAGLYGAARIPASQ